MLAILLLAGLVACGQTEETLPWSDDFADPESGWKTETDASADVAYADGVMRVLIRWSDRLAWAAAQRTYSNFHLRVEASQVAGPDDNEYGVMVRMKDKSHLYRFAISGDGYFQVTKVAGDQQTLLTDEWTLSDAIHTGNATNVIEVVCQGAQMTFRVNSVILAQVQDGDYRSGDLALYAGSFRDPGDGVEIHFDNLTLTSP
jgi:hypothetical protein